MNIIPQKAREYKEQRYRNLQDEIEIEYSVFKVVFIEITTVGYTEVIKAV